MDAAPQIVPDPGSSRRAYLDLVRLPNLFTAAADVLAGFLFAGGSSDEWYILLRLMAASVCLYAGGVALNDVCDADQDATQRPHRPIPAKLISHSTALRMSSALLIGGVAISATVSAQALLVAMAIFSSIIIYDFLKSMPVAPLFMGLCRAFNLLLGMYGLETLIPLPAVRPMSAMFLYVASLTVFARREASGRSRLQLSMGMLGMAAALLSLWGFRWYGYNARYPEYRILAGALLVVVLYLGLTTMWDPSPRRVQRAVRTLVLGIVVLDACVAWVAAGPLAGFCVLALLIPAVILARFLRVT